MSRENGFTLVELVIAIAVLSVLVALGLPSFSALMRSNRISTHANEFMASVSLARVEAIRANTGSGVCATSDNGLTCSNSWDSGWMVFDDPNGNGVFDAGEPVVRVTGGNASMAMSTSGGGTLAFNSRGIFRGGANVTFSMSPTDCPTGYLGVRNFTLLTIGQLIMTKAACP